MSRLSDVEYLAFPLRIGAAGGATSTRKAHVREQIEQVLFTNPGERWFRPDFGVGVLATVFEPNGQLLWELTRKRLMASLTDTLAGEVDPKTLDVTVQAVEGSPEQLLITISYTLATIAHTERHSFRVSPDGGGA